MGILGKRKLKHFILAPKFQLTVVSYSVLAALLIIATFYFSNRYMIGQIYAFAEAQGLPPSHPYLSFMEDQQRFFGDVFWITLTVTATCLPLGGIILSHRVAGPIYRLRMHLRSSADSGELKPLKFRKGDFFDDLVPAYNDMVDVIGEKLKK